jgi:hypothetical protein
VSSWRQRLKWAVYALLFLDFILYFVQDVEAAAYTIDEASPLLEYLGAYVTSIDLAAWFSLIILFELETWVRRGRAWTGGANATVAAVRLVCYAAILHTSFSYDIAVREFQEPLALPPSADVCAYAGGEWSFLRNREYLEIDQANCRTIGRGPDFYALSDVAVVTDRAGLEEGLILAWTDLIESLAWLAIVLLTEAAVRLVRASSGNGAVTLIGRTKAGLYFVIVAIACYWGSKQQYLYFWDELIWVLGFLEIDRNIRDARARSGPFSALPTAA